VTGLEVRIGRSESGPVEQILEHPADPYTRRLVEDVPKLTVISRR
jgi:ABC-type oligopeptide transport system ATPase subunit